jgi:hypothetical protein
LWQMGLIFFTIVVL